MKTNLELIRLILLEIDSHDDDIGNIIIPGYSQEVVGRHVRILFNQGFCDGLITTVQGQRTPIYSISGLTLSGTQYLEGVRSPVSWGKIKDILKRRGLEATIAVVMSIITELARGSITF